jgi:4-hydroxyphenylpyruvate dioxygenase
MRSVSLVTVAVWHERRTMDELTNASADRAVGPGPDAHAAETRAMTETLPRGAADKAGARVDADAYAEAADFLPLDGIDHVEFWVGNARQASAYYRALWGFAPVAYSGLETGVRDRASYVMVQNDIRFVFTAPLTPDGEVAEHVRLHGDGVHDIAFRVADVESAWRETTTRGAASALEPTEFDGGDDGILRRASIRTYGETFHSFVDRSTYHGAFAPGYRKARPSPRAAEGLSLLEVDHCVGNVELGQMDAFVDFYRDVLGFAQLIHYDDKVIHTDYSALMSKVMTNGNGRIKFPINEPATGKKKSQIQEYLDWYRSPGCQHIALRTEDIVGTVRNLRENGVEFLGLPHEYYATLADRVGDVGVPMETLEELGIEADRDEEGYLLQIFTRPVQDRPTFFFEIIERHGSRGFGVGNFKALFEAIEREQAKRGNL